MLIGPDNEPLVANPANRPDSFRTVLSAVMYFNLEGNVFYLGLNPSEGELQHIYSFIPNPEIEAHVHKLQYPCEVHIGSNVYGFMFKKPDEPNRVYLALNSEI